MKQPRLAIFDWLRTIAISLVIGDHLIRTIAVFKPTPWILMLTKSLGSPNFWWFNVGGIGVIVFLILSGMVLEYNYGGKTIKYLDFMFKRLKRLYLVYWLCLLLSYPLLLGVGWGTNLKSVFYDLSGLLLYTGQPWTDYFIPTAFFIGLIVYLYLLFPLISKMMRRGPILTLAILFLVSIIARFYIGHSNFWFRGVDAFPLCRVFEFGLGVWLVQRSKVIEFFQWLDAKIKNKFIFWTSELSFPALLIHSTILKLNLIQPPAWLSVLKFLEITIVLALAVYLLNEYISNLFWKKNIRHLNPPASP